MWPSLPLVAIAMDPTYSCLAIVLSLRSCATDAGSVFPPGHSAGRTRDRRRGPPDAVRQGRSRRVRSRHHPLSNDQAFRFDFQECGSLTTRVQSCFSIRPTAWLFENRRGEDRTTSRAQVGRLLHILAHHAVCVVLWTDGAHRGFHFADPVPRESIFSR